MNEVCFTIPGQLRGKGRARTFIHPHSGRVVTTTPPKTRAHEDAIRFYAHQAMKSVKLFTGPVCLTVRIQRRYPEKWSRAKRAANRYVVTKPDYDNQLKVFDAFKSVVWRDDNQVCELHFIRMYVEDGEDEVHVCVTELT